MSTTAAQVANHQANMTAAAGELQRALAAAKAAFDNSPAQYPTYAAAVKAADVAYCKALVASSVANSLGTGPSHTLHDLNGMDS